MLETTKINFCSMVYAQALSKVPDIFCLSRVLRPEAREGSEGSEEQRATWEWKGTAHELRREAKEEAIAYLVLPLRRRLQKMKRPICRFFLGGGRGKDSRQEGALVRTRELGVGKPCRASKAAKVVVQVVGPAGFPEEAATLSAPGTDIQRERQGARAAEVEAPEKSRKLVKRQDTDADQATFDPEEQ